MKILNIIKDKWDGFILDKLHKQNIIEVYYKMTNN